MLFGYYLSLEHVAGYKWTFCGISSLRNEITVISHIWQQAWTVNVKRQRQGMVNFHVLSGPQLFPYVCNTFLIKSFDMNYIRVYVCVWVPSSSDWGNAWVDSTEIYKKTDRLGCGGADSLSLIDPIGQPGFNGSNQNTGWTQSPWSGQLLV